ncbi:hypothetical protein K443DRAFT_113540, partial [Laccaria amethystina LaAM-08-1]
LFYWLRPKILQNQLDRFVEYWNNHRILTQTQDKLNMSAALGAACFQQSPGAFAQGLSFIGIEADYPNLL